MQSFASIFKTAAAKHGGPAAFEKELPKEKSRAALIKLEDHRYLAEFTKSIFQAGFVWRVIENKWDGFEAAFHGFDIQKNALLSDKAIHALTKDERIVRNPQKIQTVPLNAQMIQGVAQKHGSFSKLIAEWPEDDLIGLFAFLKKNGSRLGGTSAQYALRWLGKDCFIFTPDVTKALVAQQVVPKAVTSQRDMRAAQEAFNQWHEESGRSYSVISKTLACSV